MRANGGGVRGSGGPVGGARSSREGEPWTGAGPAPVVGGSDAVDEPAGGGVDQADASGVRAALVRVAWEARELGWEQLVELARSLGPDPAFEGLSDVELDRRVRVQAARLAAETCRWLELLAELVVRGVWADHGARTPAQWLSWAVGMAPSTARDHVRVGLQLRTLPRLRERFRAGRISYSKVRALTRVAVPEVEEMLLRWADGATAAEIERIVSGFRCVQRGRGAAGVRREQARGVSRRAAPDGMVDLVVRVTPEEAAEIEALLDRLVELERDVDEDGERGAGVGAGERFEAAPVAGVRPPSGAQRVDVLVGALLGAVAAGPVDSSGADRHTLVLHADADDLAGPDLDGQMAAVQDAHGRGVGMDRRVLRRLACEAGIVLVARGGDGTPVDVGRRERRLSAALRRALLARDRSCRFPGCAAARHLHAHHVRHWADGGPTDLANLVVLCGAHHRFVHEHGCSVDPTGGGRFVFSGPDDTPLPSACVLPEPWADGDAGQGFAAGVGDDPTLLLPPYWYGPRDVDIDLTVAVLDQELRSILPSYAIAA